MAPWDDCNLGSAIGGGGKIESTIHFFMHLRSACGFDQPLRDHVQGVRPWRERKLGPRLRGGREQSAPGGRRNVRERSHELFPGFLLVIRHGKDRLGPTCGPEYSKRP